MPIKFSMSMKAPKKTMPGSGNIEADCKEELGEVAAGFRARAKAETARRSSATDGDFYCCVVFQSQEQLEAFIRAARLGKPYDRFLDGRDLASKMGIELPSWEAGSKLKKPSEKLAAMAMEVTRA